MRRRGLLKLGLASAALLAVAGGSAMLLRPAMEAGRFTPSARKLLQALGAAMLDGSLPPQPAKANEALTEMVQRLEQLVAALPAATRQELQQLLALLQALAGRRLIAGVEDDWELVSVARVQQALQSMRLSRLTLRRQAYQALHDLVAAAYYSEPATWSAVGYPGPIRLAPL